MELVRIRDQLERAKNGKAGYSHASGFSIDTDADRIKQQLNQLTKKLEEEKNHTETVFGDQDKELEQIEKEMKEAEENEVKQKARMEEL